MAKKTTTQLAAAASAPKAGLQSSMSATLSAVGSKAAGSAQSLGGASTPVTTTAKKTKTKTQKANSLYQVKSAKGTSTLADQYAKRVDNSNKQINNLYDQQLAAKQQELKTAYDKNLSDRQAALDNISPAYQNQANALAVQYEKNRRNANMSALNSGLNTGTKVQQQNALNRNYIEGYTDLRNQEASALTSARQAITQLGQDYRNNLNDVQADVDAKRNQALVEEQQKNQQWLDTQAANMAQFGDFSGYEKLYGKQQAKQMKNMWIAQNPVQAYRMGLINADNFKKITGREITEVGFGDTYQSPYTQLGS